MTDGGQDFDLGQVVGSAGEKGDDGSTVWNTSTAPTYANSKYTFNISNLSGKTGLQIAVNDIIFYSTYYYIVSNVNSTTVDCSTRVSIKGSDASVTIVDNLTSTSSTSALSAKQGKVLNDNKIETSSIATSFGSTPSDSKVPSEKLTKNSLDAKQATLVSGTNIKTINNNSLLGSGNINIESGSDVDIVTSWEATLSDTKVPSEKLTKNTLDGKAPTSHASSSSTYGLGTTANYGHVKTINGLTQSSHSDGTALSAYQGKVLKDAIDAKPSASDIPTKISDLQNDSDFIETSSTSGLIKNDGSVDTTNYLPASNYVPYYYADCSTSASTQDKELTITDFNLATGVIVVVKFANANSYNGTARLKINSLAAVDIATVGTTKTSRYYWTAGEVVTFIYDGSNFVMLEGGVATTTYFGVTKLSSSTSSTSTSLAATPSAVKAAYDLANGKADVSDIPTDLSDLTDSTNLIPSKISDLTNDSDFIETSSTEGVIANDGSIIGIGTTQGTVAAGNHTHSNYISGTKVTSWSGSVSDSNIPSEKLVKNTLDDKISKSSTAGLIKNDGTIDTSTYLTQMKIGSTSGLPVKTGTNGVLAAGSFGTSAGTFAEGNHTHSNYISTSSTTGLVKNDGTIMTSGTGSGNYAAGNHTHSSYVSGTKVTSWQSTPSDSNIPSEKLVSDTFAAIEDLIGDAITYINQ